jgi:S1-C subfamily serine protease
VFSGARGAPADSLVDSEIAMARSPARAPSASFQQLRAMIAAASLCALAAFAFVSAAVAADQPAKTNLAVDPAKFFDAIVKIETRAVPDARSAATLGKQREGTGIFIGKDGLVLTIGYLIVEADDVKITDSKGRSLPAQVVGYDHASGLGLVRPVVPMHATPLPFGESATVGERAPVMIVNHSGADDVTLAFVVAKRPFTGSWEYMLDQAIFTSPPTMNWSGAALVGPDGKLLGVGSLIVRDTTGGADTLPGNMFVPIDTLKPILSDLITTGKRSGPAQPWLGVSTDEIQGRLLVSRVSPDGPADKAGVKPGDIILAVGSDGVKTQAEFYRKVWGSGAAGADIPLRVLQGADIRDVSVHSIDRVEYFRPRTTY